MDRSKRAAVDLMALLIDNLEPDLAFDIIAFALRHAKSEMILEQGASLVSCLAQQVQGAFLTKEFEEKRAAK